MARPGVAWRGMAWRRGVASESIQWTRVSLVTQSVHACAACVGARRCGISWTGACGADCHVYLRVSEIVARVRGRVLFSTCTATRIVVDGVTDGPALGVVDADGRHGRVGADSVSTAVQHHVHVYDGDWELIRFDKNW